MSQSLLLNVSPIVAGIVAVIAFYIGSIGSSNAEFSWGSETEFEDRRQFIANCVGLFFAGATAVLSLMVVLE